jgi:beta-xylosidase
MYAATIRYNKGIFHVSRTDVLSGNNFYVPATHPCGAWSDPVVVDKAVFKAHLKRAIFVQNPLWVWVFGK